MCDQYGFSPIYRTDHFTPLAMGATVMLLGSSGPISGRAFQYIDYAEPIQLLNLHGVTMLWTHTAATPPAGYELPGGTVASGSLSANGGQAVATPNTFNLVAGELVQFRFALRPVVWVGAGGGNVPQDIDLEVSLPAAINRYTLQNARGRINMLMQPALFGDAAVGPAQGANIVNPTLQPGANVWDTMSQTEMFCFEQTTPPTFTIINNGANATAAGDAVGIVIWGYKYKLSPAIPDQTWANRRVPMGPTMNAPERFITIPINSQAA